MMTWYFNREGEADGPHDEAAMKAFIAQKRLQAETLIWHPGAELWQELAQVAPSWWKPTPKVTAPPAPSAPSRRPGKESPTTRSLTPQAPSAGNKATEPLGFFKKLLGWMGKKN